MVELQITGTIKFDAVARALKEAGDKDLRKELYAGLNRATKPMRADAKKAAQDRLPQRGGLARKVSQARLSTRRRGGRDPGVRIEAKGMAQLSRIDQEGRVRHPVYGKGWVDQNISDARGWFTEAMEAGVDQAREELVQTLDDIARKLARKY